MTVTRFDDRMARATAWERTVMDWFNGHGWLAEPFGQAMLSDRMRARLRALRPAVRLRWLPDLIVVGPAGAALIDAKASPPRGSGRHAVECASSDASWSTQVATGLTVYYAFEHTGGEPGFVKVQDWLQVATEGPVSGNGSGTPYRLAACGQVCQFPTEPTLYNGGVVQP